MSEVSENGGPGALPRGNFSRPRPFYRWERPFCTNYTNDVEMMLLRCLIDNEHYLQNV